MCDFKIDNSTDNEKIQASTIIEEHCCGQGLPIGLKACDLSKRVQKLELENYQLWQVINEMLKES